MATSSQISVPWECITDGKTRQGANLKHHLEALLNHGFPLEVETPDGVRKFSFASDFSVWFDKIGVDSP